ncbi:Predicted arabinose efflux permease, MFS family [Paenibacillaceae bacterium GAS479]|nr:Predicted arabinose efflux permease, MFS family [Paenibacillaceae bacterium GAS479]
MRKAQIVMLHPHKMLILAVMGCTQAAIFLVPYMTSAFYDPILNALDITNTQLGVLMTIYGILALITVFPGGWLADRVDTKKLILSCLLISSVIGVVAAFVMEYVVYCILWGLLGVICNLLYWSAAIKTVRFVGDEHEQGKAYGYFNAFNFGASSLFNAGGVAILAGFAASSMLGLRYILLYFSVLCLLAAVLVKFFVASIEPESSTREQPGSAPPRSSLRDIVHVLRKKQVWLFAIISFCCYSVLQISTYFTPYFGDVMNLNVASAGLIYVLTGPLSIMFGPIFGILSDWLKSAVKLITVLMALSLGLLAIMIFSPEVSLTTAIAVDALIVVGGGGAYTIMFASMDELGIERKYAGISVGLVSVIAYSPDSFMYILFGSWLDKFGNEGYDRIFIYSAVLCVIAVTAGITLMLSGRKVKAEAAAQSKLPIGAETQL